MPQTLVMTVDIDWAPDWAILELLEFLVDNKIHSTWFVTHETPALDSLRAHPDLVDLGIHPNFMAGSSHGSSTIDVLEHCLRIVPEAKSMRAHALVQSTPILQVVADSSAIEVEASLYMRDARQVRPHDLPLDRGKALTRLPYVWEDDLEFFADDPSWNAEHFLQARDSDQEVTMIDVHPIHYALNSASIAPYHALKREFSDVRSVGTSDARRLRHDGEGTRSFVEGLPALTQKVDLSSSLLQVARRS